MTRAVKSYIMHIENSKVVQFEGINPPLAQAIPSNPRLISRLRGKNNKNLRFLARVFVFVNGNITILIRQREEK